MSVVQDCNQVASPFAIIDGIFTDIESLTIERKHSGKKFSVVKIEIVARDKKRISKIKDVLTTTCYSIKKLDDPIFIFTEQMVHAGTMDNKLRVEIENIAGSGTPVLSVSFRTDKMVSTGSITEARKAIP